MPREHVLSMPNRGLNGVAPPSRLRPGQSHRAENVEFTETTVRRRRGSDEAYRWAHSSGIDTEVSVMKRYYQLTSTGTVNRFFIYGYKQVDPAGNEHLFYGDFDWDDDSATPVASHTQIASPRNDSAPNNTLYTGYGSGQVEWDDDVTWTSLEAKGWCYFAPSYSSGDDTDDMQNVPFRTQCVLDDTKAKSFLHGLTPPAAVNQSDTGHAEVPATADWTFEEIKSGGTSSVISYETSIGTELTEIKSVHMAVLESVVASTSRSNYIKNSGTVWIDYGGPDSLDNDWVCGHIGSDNVTFHMARHHTDSGADSLEYFTWDGTSWSNATTITNGAGTECHMDVDSMGNVHIAFSITAGGHLWYATNSGGAWSAEPVDATVSTAARYPKIRMDADDVPHIIYYANGNDEVRHAWRDDTSTWTLETVETGMTTVTPSGIAFDSNGAIGAVYSGPTGGGEVRYSQKLDGVWTAHGQIDSTFNVAFFIDLEYDKDNNAIAVYGDNATSTRIARGSGASWSSAEISTSILDATMALDVDNSIIHFTGSSGPNIFYDKMKFPTYYYKVTAQYDDGVLGESGPSPATAVILWESGADEVISENSTQDIIFGTGTGDQDMTDDVTKLFIYRTFRNADANSPYRRAGSVDCTAGVPADFTDDINDVTLAAQQVLDEDIYMPPKYKTAVWWKDRLVIGNLKARDTSDEDELDAGETAASSIHKNRIRFSTAQFPDRFRQLFFQDIIPDGDSGSIQRLIVNRRRDTLVVLMENDVVELRNPVFDVDTSALSAPFQNVPGASGTPAPFSAVEWQGQIIYWTKWGIESTNGLSSRIISSDTIGFMWNQLNAEHLLYDERINMDRIDQVYGIVHEDELGSRVIWTYPAGDSTFNNRALILDLSRWADQGFQGDGVFSINPKWSFGVMESWDGEGDRGELFGGGNGVSTGTTPNTDLSGGETNSWIYRLFFGDTDSRGEHATSTGVAVTKFTIPMKLYPGLTDAGSRADLKRWKTARIMARADTNTQVTLLFDAEEGTDVTQIDQLAGWAVAYPTPSRMARNLPRANISHYGGIRLEIDDGASDGEPPFELYQSSLEVEDVKTRRRGGA